MGGGGKGGPPGGLGALVNQNKPGMEKRVSHAEIMEMGHTPPEDESIASRTEHMWDRMTEKNLSPLQEAELTGIRAQIKAMEASLDALRAAEKKILMSNR